MNIDLIFKIAGIGIVIAVLNQLLTHSGRSDQALMTTIAGLVIVMIMVISEIGKLFNLIKSVFGF